jgi:Zn-dependent metalloprotease
MMSVTVPAGGAFAAPPAPSSTGDVAASAPEGAQVSIKRATGVASFVLLPESAVAETTAVAGDPETRARAFLAQNAALFGIRDQALELATREVVVDAAGNTHVAFRQTHRGLAVFGGDLRVHMNAAGRVTSAGGTFVPDVTVATRAALPQTQAEQVALAEVAAANPNAGALTVLAVELLVYRTGLVQGVVGENRLAYRVEAGNGAAVRDQVFVDALSATVLDRFPMIANALYREIYSPTMTPANLVWKEGDAMPTDTEYLNLINGAGETYNLFGSMTNGGWRSFNGADAVMKSIAKYNPGGGYCPNASWNGINTQFCNQVTGDDTVAHEWGHAYTEYTHNLIYAWQPGALNESYSDIWGETVDLLNGRGKDSPSSLRKSDGSACSQLACASQAPKTDNTYRWVSGEDDPGFRCPIRDMWRPECYSNPGKVISSFYQCDSSDGGGVHTNSGVPNHAYALTVDGGTFNGQTITGIGLTKAAHLYWHAQRYYQTNTTDFGDHADALEAACQDLKGQPLYELKTAGTGWGATTPAITQADCDQLPKVALAVQFRTAPNCVFTPMFQPNPPALCAIAGDAPQNHLFQDFETGLGAWTTQQTPSNPATWDDRPWTVTTNAPDGHPGSAGFGPNPVVGDCSADMDNGITSLLSPVVAIPASAAAPVRMAWDHLVSMEIEYDGGNLKASVNGGAFALVPASAFTFNAYNASLAPASSNDNPMAGEAAWTGGDGGAVSSKWGQSQIDLSKIGVDPGDTVQFRWDLGSDGCNGWDGWYVDDVRVYSCAPCATPNAPTGLGIAAPNATTVSLNWPSATGATQYEVWTAENAPYFDVTGKTCANPAPYACSVTASLTYNATDLGDAAVNHSYVVRGANSCGQASAPTNHVGEFEFGLVKGN